MTAPARARNTIFERSADGGTVWETIGEVTSISGGGITTEIIDTTALNPVDGFRTSIPGVKDTEEVSVSLNLDTDTEGADTFKQGLLRADVEGEEKPAYRMVFFDGGGVEFLSSTPTGFTLGDMTVEGKLEATFTFKPDGKPDWTAVPAP